MSLKLEVGKTYVTQSGRLVKIVHYESDKEDGYLGVLSPSGSNKAISIWLHKNGKYFDTDHGFAWNIIKEYKPPVVHRRDLLWMKTESGHTFPLLVSVGANGYRFCKILSRTLVEYTEVPE